MHAVELLGPAAFMFLADQLAKMLAARLLPRGRSVFLVPCVQLRYTTNVSRARRFPRTRPALLFLWGSTVVTLILVMQQGYFFRHSLARIALGTALGGAASNLYDRLRRGAVIDVVKVGWWPVFNLADVGITVGALAALWFIR
jgi:signal peptidase II